MGKKRKSIRAKTLDYDKSGIFGDDKILFDSYGEMHPGEDMKGDRRRIKGEDGTGMDPINVAPWLQPSQRDTSRK